MYEKKPEQASCVLRNILCVATRDEKRSAAHDQKYGVRTALLIGLGQDGL